MRMSNQLLFIALALIAGTMIPFQSAMNAQLGKTLTSPYYASLIVFLVAAAGLIVYIALQQFHLPTLGQLTSAPKWSYLGGILGGTYILLIVLCAPRLGIGNVTVMVLLGQVIAAAVIDHFGILNAPIHPLNWLRLIGIALVIGGVYVVRKY